MAEPISLLIALGAIAFGRAFYGHTIVTKTALVLRRATAGTRADP